MDVLVTDQDFDVGSEYAKLSKIAPKSGAVVLFVGLVRDFYSDADLSVAEEDTVDYLELEHYPGMTESLCQEIVDEANQRYPFEAVRLIHRVGRIKASEKIVMVAVASQHREDAFQAAQFIMDYLKTRATFWKKEVGARGKQWLGLKDQDIQAAARWKNKDHLEA